jgi:hypothetical protein
MQLFSVFVSFGSEIFKELNEAIPFLIIRKSDRVRSQYVHVSDFAGTLSHVSQVMQ